MPFKDPEKRKLAVRKSMRKRWIEKKSILQASLRLINNKIKLDVYNHYGGPICNCCGEMEWNFLTMDHINGNGRQHRSSTGGKLFGINLYRWLRKQNYPSGFQVLCDNCNHGKFRNGGICPHKSGTTSRIGDRL